MRHTFGNDFLASLVVFLVALPLCMGIAIACGVPPALGIISGIVGGLIVGPLGGCQLQVSGPAAGLVVIVSSLIAKYGVEQLGVVLLVGGICQVLAGLCRWAHWFRAVPPSVVHGMLSGIGILILVSQFHVMLDHIPGASGLSNICGIPTAITTGLFPLETTSHHLAAAIGIMTIVILVCWNNLQIKALKFIPGPLVAIVVATLVATATQLPIKHVSIPENLAIAFNFPSFQDLHGMTLREVLLDGLAIAVIATAETLLSATAIDKLHRGRRTDYNRELTSQGIGNSISALVGGLPITGVMVRSSTNVAAGAKTRMSAFLHGLWLLLFVVFLSSWIKLIPTCSLAALLVYIGYKLANFKVIGDLRKVGSMELIIYVITVATIVCVDLLTGVTTGIVLCFAKLLYRVSHLEIRIAEDAVGETHIFLRGTASFLTLPRLAETIEELGPDKLIHLHIDGLSYIDHACLELIYGIQKRHFANGGELVVDWRTLNRTFESRGKPRSKEKAGARSIA
ncbi:MAG: SulP family inorganic anion transporter [Candidatus Melainabacteria bacterium]|nr:MAG: SulP family inorganic anion transporter [Candidatus Melainabacteria bacterium]